MRRDHLQNANIGGPGESTLEVYEAESEHSTVANDFTVTWPINPPSLMFSYTFQKGDIKAFSAVCAHKSNAFHSKSSNIM